MPDCFGVCSRLGDLADGWCDYWFDCPTLNNDAGDCDDWYCWEDYVMSCSGGCVPASYLNDGFCDLQLDCGDFNFDAGDCF